MNYHFIKRLFVFVESNVKCMVNKRKLFKMLCSLGIKGILCLICLGAVGFALVTYTNTVTISPTIQLSVGQTTASWTIYVNEVDQVRYMPGDFSQPTLSTADSTTYSFKVTTDAYKVCAVKVELTTAMDPDLFSTFQITVLSSTGGAWGTQTLYSAPTGGTTKDYVDGLTPGDAAYIHQGLSTVNYYLIEVTYSYDLASQNTQIPVTFQYTPLPQDGF
jgi:hypothetical protein